MSRERGRRPGGSERPERRVAPGAEQLRADGGDDGRPIAPVEAASDDDPVEEPTDLLYVGPATAATLSGADIDAAAIADGDISYRELVEAGVNHGVAAKIRREHSLAWSFDGGDLDRRSEQVWGLNDGEREWVAEALEDDESDDATADEDDADDAAWREGSSDAGADWRATASDDGNDRIEDEAAWRAASDGDWTGDDDQTGGDDRTGDWTGDDDRTGDWTGDDDRTGDWTSDDDRTGDWTGDDDRTGDWTGDDDRTGDWTGDDDRTGDDGSTAREADWRAASGVGVDRAATDGDDAITAEQAWRDRSEPTPIEELSAIDDAAAAALREAGITSVRSLATIDPELIADTLGRNRETVSGWREAARGFRE